MQQIKKINVFFGSPSDVSEERKKLHEVIEDLNRDPDIQRAYGSLIYLNWKDVPPKVGDEPESIILKQYPVESWDIFILDMWQKCGTPTEGEESGTIREFKLAHEQMNRTGDIPIILVYRSFVPAPPQVKKEDREQYEKVCAFYDEIQEKYKGLYSGEYYALDEFKPKIYKDLKTTALSILTNGTGPFHDPFPAKAREKFFNNFISSWDLYDPKKDPEIKLSQFYIHPSLVDRTSPEVFSKGLNIEEEAINYRLNRVQKDPRIPFQLVASEVMDKAVQYVIIGEPGIGKTTLLKMIGIHCAEGRKKLPILIRLAEFGAYLQDPKGKEQAFRSVYNYSPCIQYIKDQVLNEEFPNATTQDIIEALEKGDEIVLLFDALDEIGNYDLRKQVIEILKKVIARFSKMSILVTMREIAAEFRPGKELELTPLSIDEIQEFITRWLDKPNSIIRDQFIKKIQKDRKYQVMMSNPQMLYMLVKQLKEQQQPSDQVNPFPDRKGKLYQMFINHFLEERPGMRLSPDVATDPAVITLSRSVVKKKRYLSKIAYEMQIANNGQGQWHADQTQMVSWIQDADPTLSEEQATSCLVFLVEEIGLLREVSNHRYYGFSHFPFQCYFTAQYFLEKPQKFYSELIERAMRPGWQEVFILYYFLKHPEDRTFIQMLVDGTEENIFGTLLLLAGKCICERDQDYHSETHRLVTHKLYSLYRDSPWLGKKRKVFDVIKQLPNIDLIEFIQEEIQSSDQERRQQCIQLLRDLQSNEVVEVLSDQYENNVHITFNERNGIIDTIVRIELPLALNVLDRLMIRDSKTAERIVREMMITNPKRYINHILDNLKRSLYPEETKEMILSQIGTAENLDQLVYTGIETEFERLMNMYASNESHLAKLISWIKFSAPVLAPKIYPYLQSDHAGLRFAVIDFIPYQQDAASLIDALTNIYWGNNTSNEDRVKCMEVLLKIGESQESLVIMWLLETQQIAVEHDMALAIYCTLGSYGFGESFKYLETQLANHMHVNANRELLCSTLHNLYRIARNRSGVQPIDRSTIQYAMDLIPLAQADSDLCDAIVFLALKFGEISQQNDLLNQAVAHRDLSIAIVKYLALFRDFEFLNRVKPKIYPILKSLRDTEETLLIDYLFLIEDDLLLEKSRSVQDQFVVSNLRSPNPFIRIRTIQRYEMDRHQEEAIEIITELLYSSKHIIKEKAIFLFGEMGSEITPLRSILNDPSYAEDAYRAIEKIARRKDQFGLRELKEHKYDYDR